MTAFNDTYKFIRGDDFTVIFEMTTDGSTPLNVSGRTYAMQMRTSPDSTTATSWSCSVGGSNNNEVTCTVSDTVTANLTPGTYVWDLQENASGVITTVGGGSIKVAADVTR